MAVYADQHDKEARHGVYCSHHRSSNVHRSVPQAHPDEPGLCLQPDPRRQASITYPLPAMLTLAVTTLLCAHTSVLAMAQWGAQQSADFLQRLCFPEGRAPCRSTLHRLFRKLDPRALSAALGAHFAGTVLPATPVTQGIAIDDKAQRGRCQYDPAGPPIHVPDAFGHERGVVLASEPIERRQEEGDRRKERQS